MSDVTKDWGVLNIQGPNSRYMCNVQCTIVHYRLYIVQCTLYIVQLYNCTMYIVHCTIVHTQSSLNFLRTGMMLLCGVNLLFRLYCLESICLRLNFVGFIFCVSTLLYTVSLLSGCWDRWSSKTQLSIQRSPSWATNYIVWGKFFLKRLYYVESNCLKLHFVGFIFC